MEKKNQQMRDSIVLRGMKSSAGNGRINIAASAQRLDVDNRISLRYYCRIADNILKQVWVSVLLNLGCVSMSKFFSYSHLMQVYLIVILFMSYVLTS